MTALSAPHTGAPAGWLDDEHPVWISRGQALITDRSGSLIRTVDLDASRAEVEQWTQWVGPVSTGTGLVAAGGSVFSLLGDRPGKRVVPPPVDGDRIGSCPMREAAVDPVVEVRDRGGVILERSGSLRLVVADPHLGIDCSVWAVDALHASPHDSLSSRIWGDRTGWITWWWREATAGLVTAVAVGVVLARRARRRRLRSTP